MRGAISRSSGVLFEKTGQWRRTARLRNEITLARSEGYRFLSGEGEIRTPGTIAGTPVFETGAFNRSATSPGWFETLSDWLELVKRLGFPGIVSSSSSSGLRTATRATVLPSVPVAFATCPAGIARAG